MKSKLLNGVIPKNTICPFKDYCNSISNCPGEKQMSQDFSCALAKGFDVTKNLLYHPKKLKVIQ